MNGATDAYFYGRCAPLLETLKPEAAATTTTTECIIDALHKASIHGAREGSGVGSGVGSMPCDPTIAALPRLRDGEEIKLATH